jgi:endonuclease/exonuclease/phosphatase family metal-dependent hydrolase
VATCLEWPPEDLADRLAQARSLAETAADAAFDGPLPVLVAGDLNAAPDGPVMEPLQGVLIDTWSAGPGDSDGVTLGSRHPPAPEESQLIDQRIDHVLVRPGHPGQQIVVKRAELAGDPVDGL